MYAFFSSLSKNYEWCIFLIYFDKESSYEKVFGKVGQSLYFIKPWTLL